MSEVEIDLGVLEDMCSEIGDPAVLIDNSMNIIWMNSLMKQRIDINIKDLFTDSKNIFEKLEAQGLLRSEISKVFENGKILKHNFKKHNIHSAVISIPVKYGPDVVYSLNILEEHDLYQEMPIITAQASDHDILLTSFMDMDSRPCFIVMNGHIVATNNKFDKTIGSNHILKRFLHENMKDFDKDFRHLKLLFNYSFHIKKKAVKKDKNIIGQIYFLNKRVSKNVKKSHNKINNLKSRTRSKSRASPKKLIKSKNK
jgi:hypothetical protein